MGYIVIAIAVLSGGFGFTLSYMIDKAEIQHMSDSIVAQNREAELQLATLTEQADRAHTEALKLNKELEDANVSAINAINSQHDAFKSQRMYDNGRKSSGCAMSTNTNTASVNDAPTNDGGLSEELTEFLKSEAYRADQVSAYAKLCQKFVVDNNCGIAK
jgi:hypothetical protein